MIIIIIITIIITTIIDDCISFCTPLRTVKDWRGKTGSSGQSLDIPVSNSRRNHERVSE